MTPLTAMTPLFAVSFFESDEFQTAAWSLVILVCGIIGSRMLGAISGRVVRARGSRQGELITRRLVFYVAATATLIATLRFAGVDIGVLLGTAGILTVAIGFASQTSASNVISGLFLLFERPFVVGDIIRLNSLTGEVLSVDMLSVKMRTFDNLYVRIPNETLLKSEIANISHFPIRRLDLKLMVAYGEDMETFREALFAVSAENPYLLDEPTPLVIVDEFRESAVVVQFSVWSSRENFIDAKSTVLEVIQREIYGGRFRAPHPVRILVDADGATLHPLVDADR